MPPIVSSGPSDVSLKNSGGTVIDPATETTTASIKTAVEAVNTALQTAGITQVQLAAVATALQIIDNFISGSRGLVTEDNSASIKSALEIIDNMISGSEAQVDVVAALPTGTNVIGQIIAILQTASLYDGTTSLTPKFAVIDHATSGDNTIVSAVTDKKILILAAFMIAAGTVSVRFESGAGGTAMSGQMDLIVNVGFVLPFSPVGWGKTATNTLLNLELSAAVSVDGILVYVEVA